MFTLESRWEGTSKCGATLFDSCLHKQWLVEQSFSCSLLSFLLTIFSLFLSLSLLFAIYLMSEGANYLNVRRDDAKCVKEERNERTNEPASFCLYSSYSRRTVVYIFFFPQRSNRSSLNEQHCVFVHISVHFVS
jgi:hypothetical protein